MNIRQKYSDICSFIPENGVSLEQLKDIITTVTNYHRDETLVHHIKIMERMGFIIRKDLTFFSTYKYPKKNEIAPAKKTPIKDEAEKEADEFLEKFRGSKPEE